MNFPFNAPPPGAFHPRIWKPLYSCGVNSAKPTGKRALQVLLAIEGNVGPLPRAGFIELPNNAGSARLHVMQALRSFDIGTNCAKCRPRSFHVRCRLNGFCVQNDAASTSCPNEGNAKLLRPPRRLTASHMHTALTFTVFTASPDYATLKRIYAVR